MTKTEVLQDIDKLCADIDKWIGKKVKALSEKDDYNVTVANNQISRLLIDANQELSFLRDYIDENVKEE